MGRRRKSDLESLSLIKSDGSSHETERLQLRASEGRRAADISDLIPHLDQTLAAKHHHSYSRDGVHITWGDAASLYDQWPSPVAIISDGPYGVSGFPGDPPIPDDLGAWYEPHIRKWSEKTTPLT